MLKNTSPRSYLSFNGIGFPISGLPQRKLHSATKISISLCLLSGTLSKASLAEPAQDFETRAKNIVAQMTLDEKIGQMHGTRSKELYRIVVGLPRLGIPDLLVTNGPAGFGPAGPGHESVATALPAPIALASTWDLDAARQFGAIEAGEAAGFGNTFYEAPTINIARIPQNGRTFEGYGEDPYLVGRLAVANIQGIQSQGIIANVKHFALNNQEEKRTSINAQADERTLREIYLPAFEAAVKEGQVASLMGAYNKVNGVYCCENDVLLNQILRNEWGFKGFVTSDFGAVRSTVDSVMHGLDVEMPNDKYFGAPLKAAIDAGQVPVSVIDEHLVRRFRTMMQVGVWDHPPVLKPIPVEQNAPVARRLATEGAVLLRNQGKILPLNPKALHQVALIGPGATSAVTGGGGSSKVKPAIQPISPLDGLQQALGPDVKVDLYNGDDIATAAAGAKAADVAILMLKQSTTEGKDNVLNLPTGQDDLVAAVLAANPKTIVVLKTGGPVIMPWADKVPAILEAWLPGQADGEAIASLLVGTSNPSGKLPITFPQHASDVPASTPDRYPGVDGAETYSEGVMVGYRWYDQQKIAPLFPFGHGLSYSTFAYSNLRLSGSTVKLNAPTLTVSFDVANTSGPSGDEVAQVYLGLPTLPGVPQPPSQLKGFSRVSLPTGGRKTVSVTLDARAFSYWDTQTHGWKVAPGRYAIQVCSSSRDTKLQGRVTVK